MSDETKTENKKPWPFGDEQRRMAAEIAASALKGLKINFDNLEPESVHRDVTKLKDHALFIESMERLSRVPDHDAAEKAIEQMQSMFSGMLQGIPGMPSAGGLGGPLGSGN